MNAKELCERARIDIVFDGPPSHECGRFVEVEDAQGRSIKLGEWVERADGFWALRIADPRLLLKALEVVEALHGRRRGDTTDDDIRAALSEFDRAAEGMEKS